MTIKQGHGPCPSCPSSDAFYRWSDGHAHCFSCGYHESGSSIESVKAKLDPMPESSTELSLLEYVYKLSPVAIQWLNKYGITKDEILKYKLMWNQRTESLAFPIFKADKIVATNERTFNDRSTTKYLTRGKPHKNLPILKGKSSKSIVLVEDFVSAIKVTRVCDSMPLFGANVPTSVINTLHKLSYDKVFVWLDCNKANESMKFSNRMSQILTGVNCIITTLDPKEYSTSEIKRWIAT